MFACLRLLSRVSSFMYLESRQRFNELAAKLAFVRVLRYRGCHIREAGYDQLKNYPVLCRKPCVSSVANLDVGLGSFLRSHVNCAVN